MNTVRPRIAWNAKLFKEWESKSKVAPEFIAVEQQLPTHIVNSRAIKSFGYNPSIIDFGSRTFMAYRYHPRPSWETSIAIAELDAQFNVIADKAVNLPRPSNDDPRLFEFSGSLYISYVHAAIGTNGQFDSTIRYGKLIEKTSWEVEGQTAVQYGQNLGPGMEKNWVPFSYGGRIQFIYKAHIENVVIDVDSASVMREFKSPGVKWIWGEIRGGTTPVNYKGKWLRFFHSKTASENARNYNRYFVGAMTMEPFPPFNILQISSRPVLIGSEIDSLSTTDKAKCPFRYPNVAFPLGCVARDDKWILSVGINHGQCGLVTVCEENLNLCQ